MWEDYYYYSMYNNIMHVGMVYINVRVYVLDKERCTDKIVWKKWNSITLILSIQFVKIVEHAIVRFTQNEYY